jgi:DNA-binding winged helix-turn-helix (wHTH) protein
MNLVSIGEFTVDLDERRIFRLQTELFAEPKVVEVLCYLIQNNERFISLSELHENVWAGRVVTDTAVRRTISKLRTLLEDNDTENPRFIKSQMKRGYQITNVLTQKNPPAPIERAFDRNTVAENSKSVSKLSKPKHINIAFIIIGLICAALYGIIVIKDMNATSISAIPLLDIPGEKISLTVSEDGRYQAFVGRLNSSMEWLAYLNDSMTGQLIRLVIPGETIHSISFVGNRLAAVSYIGDVASLYMNTPGNFLSEFKKLDIAGFPLIDKVVSLDENTVFINVAKNFDSAFLYYSLNLSDLLLTQFTYSNHENIRDYNAVISPNGALFALTRQDKNGKKLSIQIYSITTKELITDWTLPFSSKVFAIEWLSDSDLILAIDSEVKALSIVNGFKKNPVSNIHIGSLAKGASGKLFALVNESSDLQVFETALPYNEAFTRRFQLDDAVEQFYFSYLEGQYWIVEYLHGQYILSKYTAEGKVKKPIFYSENFFRLLDQTSHNRSLLLRHNWQLQVLNTENADVIPVSIRTQSIEYAAFNNDGKKVYFSENVAQNWFVNEFDLITRSQKRLLSGYRAFLPYGEKFIGVSETGNLRLLASNFDSEITIPVTLNMRYPYRIFIRGDALITLNRLESADWELTYYHLATKKLTQSVVKSNQLGSAVSIDENGNNLLYIKDKESSGKLVSLGYNFGYD